MWGENNILGRDFSPSCTSSGRILHLLKVSSRMGSYELTYVRSYWIGSGSALVYTIINCLYIWMAAFVDTFVQ